MTDHDTAPDAPPTVPRVDAALLAGNRRPMAAYQATHFQWQVQAGVGTITLHRPERKNPLTFSAYAELRDLFNHLRLADDVHAVVLTGAGGNFCSGGDVHEIIGPLIRLTAPELLAFTRMTGDLVKHMRGCPQPIVAAIDGVCAGAGAILAMASDMRLGTPRAKVAFLFNKVGLAGCDMGACAMLPRIVGQGRASELLYTGRNLGGEEGERWGFFNRLCAPDDVLAQARALAADLVAGPTFANGITKTMLQQEWAMTIEQAIEAEAQAQALCMLTQDFHRAYHAFVAKQKPVFQGD
jgi:enoyl-CoA hydratase/carnithine racemase